VNILKALQRLLRHEPIRCDRVDAADAFELIDRYEPQVVVSDQRMPQMNGVDFLSAVRDRHGDIVRMMLTGYTDMTIAVEAINKGEIYRLITKPWNDDELRATLRQAFDHFDLKAEIKRLNQVTREQNFKLQDTNGTWRRRSRAHKQLDGRPGAAYRLHQPSARWPRPSTQDTTPQPLGAVAVYSSRTRQMSLRKDMIERIYFAGLLHDVGKIGVPDAIITKPDRLTEAEYAEIMRHPEIGAKILEPVEFLRSVVPCVRHHHEWYDGCSRGYPTPGRRPDPLPARDRRGRHSRAMTSDRPYRKALPLEAVTAELHKFSGPVRPRRRRAF
jgi:response regulator RpfG family c-di-GMP phosphodiesterase